MASLSVSRLGQLERECAVHLRDVGLNRWQHRVVGGEMFSRQVAGCSVECVAQSISRA